MSHYFLPRGDRKWGKRASHRAGGKRGSELGQRGLDDGEMRCSEVDWEKERFL